MTHNNCHCTKTEQCETSPIGYPDLLCEDCQGTGVYGFRFQPLKSQAEINAEQNERELQKAFWSWVAPLVICCAIYYLFQTV